jgi:hypothetical protein
MAPVGGSLLHRHGARRTRHGGRGGIGTGVEARPTTALRKASSSNDGDPASSAPLLRGGTVRCRRMAGGRAARGAARTARTWARGRDEHWAWSGRRGPCGVPAARGALGPLADTRGGRGGS